MYLIIPYLLPFHSYSVRPVSTVNASYSLALSQVDCQTDQHRWNASNRSLGLAHRPLYRADQRGWNASNRPYTPSTPCPCAAILPRQTNTGGYGGNEWNAFTPCPSDGHHTCDTIVKFLYHHSTSSRRLKEVKDMAILLILMGKTTRK